MSAKAVRKCFFAYTFPHFAWIFPFFPLLPNSQQQIFQQKFRVGLRLVYRCLFVSSRNLYSIVNDKPLVFYVKQYISKRLKNMYTTDLDRLLFYDIFLWKDFYKKRRNTLVNFFIVIV